MMSMPGGTWMWDGHEDRFDRAIEWLLVPLLAFMPFAYGAVEAWSEEVVIALAAAISLCFLVKIAFTKGASLTWTWAYIPVAAFLAIAAVQLAPLPVRLARFISPNTVAQKSELLQELDSASVPLTHVAISFYSYATRHDLRLVLSVAAVFAVVVNVFRQPAQISRLLRAIVAIGTAVFVLALAQDVFGNDRIYWVGAIVGGGAHSGPFINHSHYAQFANLCIGAALGLIYMQVHQDFVHRPVTPTSIAEYLGSPEARSVWVLSAITMIGAATVFVSLSRGGMISMMIAGAFTTLVLSARKSLRGTGWIMAVMGLGAFICVLYIGFDAVYERLGTLGRMSGLQGSRREILRDVASAWVKFPLTGTGLGTHEVVYPMFDRSAVPALAAQAENEYAQAAEETGAAGFLALAGFGAIVWHSYVRTIRSAHVPVQSAAYGLGFGLAAIMVHSLSDFGQHLPANASLSAIFCALLLRLPRLAQDEDAERDEVAVTHRRSRRAGLLGLAVAAAVWGWALLDADAARRSETSWAKVAPAERSLKERFWEGSNQEYMDLLRDAISAQERQPDNIKYCHWLNVYRWCAISRVMDPGMRKIVVPPQGVEFAARIVDEFKQGLHSCPTFGPGWCVLGQLEKTVLGRAEEGRRHIRRGRKLAPCDPTACFVSGLLHAEDGDAEAAFREWQRAAQLDERLFREAALLFVGSLGRPELSCRLATDNPSRLVELEDILRDARDYPELLREVRSNLVRLLEQDCRREGSPAWKFARLAQEYREDGRRDEAICMYRQALALNYGDVDWRLALAQLLAEAGALEQAAHEASICMQFRPGHAAAKSLSENLSVRLHTAQLSEPASRTQMSTREE
jgi:tetratricopeptide (TPR) repeat protein